MQTTIEKNNIAIITVIILSVFIFISFVSVSGCRSIAHEPGEDVNGFMVALANGKKDEMLDYIGEGADEEKFQELLEILQDETIQVILKDASLEVDIYKRSESEAALAVAITHPERGFLLEEQTGENYQIKKIDDRKAVVSFEVDIVWEGNMWKAKEVPPIREVYDKAWDKFLAEVKRDPKVKAWNWSEEEGKFAIVYARANNSYKLAVFCAEEIKLIDEREIYFNIKANQGEWRLDLKEEGRLAVRYIQRTFTYKTYYDLQRKNFAQVPVPNGAVGFSDSFYIEGLTDEKLVALTFDDGPDARYTEETLDILAEYGVPATYFLIGENTLRFPDVAKRIVAEGHEVGNHSFNHPDFRRFSSERVYSEQIERTQEIFKEVLGVEPHIFRPPYGAITPEQVDFFAEKGIKTVNWSIDTHDWNKDFNSVETMFETVKRYKHPGAIVLMHSGGGPRPNTVELLPELIEMFQEKGYKFVTVGELLI
ncbi:peptidoglycan/xylan/chitin deacetylase (PgdA/CDA1 family) [Desulfitispora alkaliphila]|uniref:polysaccharide deacetylase family protein n=1 Tax=Desulfitispora alkaliphila TaxID=622674 RepID=UPI003D1C09E3